MGPRSENLFYDPKTLVPYALDWENAKIVHFLALSLYNI